VMTTRVIHKDDGPCWLYGKRISLCLEYGVQIERTSVRWRDVTCKNCLRLQPKKGKR
jgi:hypothetical protein